MFWFPTKPDEVATAARVLGLSVTDKQRAIDATRLISYSAVALPSLPPLPRRKWQMVPTKVKDLQGCWWRGLLLCTTEQQRAGLHRQAEPFFRPDARRS